MINGRIASVLKKVLETWIENNIHSWYICSTDKEDDTI